MTETTNTTDEFKQIDINEMINKIINSRARNGNYYPSNYDILNDISINISKNFEPNEYIINYSYIHNWTGWGKSYRGLQLIFITNFGSVYTQNGMAYRGKCKLSYNILKTLNIVFNMICGDMQKPNDEIYYSNIIGGSISLHRDSSYGGGYYMDSRYLILVKVIDFYLNQPLIGEEAQKLINENEELKRENNIMKYLFTSMKKENEETKELQNKLNQDMEKYKNIQNLEEKWKQIKEYKNKLDIIAMNLEQEREKLENEKKQFEYKKMHKQMDNLTIEFDDFINN